MNESSWFWLLFVIIQWKKVFCEILKEQRGSVNMQMEAYQLCLTI